MQRALFRSKGGPWTVGKTGAIPIGSSRSPVPRRRGAAPALNAAALALVAWAATSAADAQAPVEAGGDAAAARDEGVGLRIGHLDARCPSGPEIGDEVEAQLGRALAGPDPTRIAVSLDITPTDGPNLRARMTFTDGPSPAGERFLEASDCQELIRSVALSIAVTADALLAMAPAVAAATSMPAATSPAASSPAASSPAAVPPPEVAGPQAPAAEPFADAGAGPRARVELAGLGTVGVLPDPAAGASVGLGFGLGRFTLVVEGRWLPEVTLRTTTGPSASLAWGGVGVRGCHHVSVVSLCLWASGAWIRGKGQGVSDPATADGQAAWAGAAVRAAWPLGQGLELFGGVEAGATLLRPEARIAGELLWRGEVAMGALALGLAFEGA